jgi:hypothetical protein
MESVMLSSNPPQPQFPAVKIIIEAVADWIKRYRDVIKFENELARVDPDQITAMARDLGITAAQLRELASKGPESTNLLKRLLMALDTDPKRLEQIDPRVARDMLWMCFNCSDKSRCKHELSAGTAAQNFREFCPNALSLDELFDLKSDRQ